MEFTLKSEGLRHQQVHQIIRHLSITTPCKTSTLVSYASVRIKKEHARSFLRG
jgi:hypothetical protein